MYIYICISYIYHIKASRPCSPPSGSRPRPAPTPPTGEIAFIELVLTKRENIY